MCTHRNSVIFVDFITKDHGVCSYLVHNLLMSPSWHLHDFFITCPSLVHFLYMTWSRLFHDLFTTCSHLDPNLLTSSSWLVHDLLLTCPWLVHNLIFTCSWLVHYFLFSFHDSSIIHLWLVYNYLGLLQELWSKLLVIVCDLFMTYYLLLTCSLLVHDIFMNCSLFFMTHPWLVHNLFSSSNIISFFTCLCLQALM